jgi:hypothetical protein
LNPDIARRDSSKTWYKHRKKNHYFYRKKVPLCKNSPYFLM